jgi:collagenase-like PrtC family protease
MRFDVPFTPDKDYPEFLVAHQDHLAGVHFSLHDPALADARQRMEVRPAHQSISALAKLDSTPKHVLLNTRLHDPAAYFDKTRLAATAERLTQLREQAGINGLIFADPYYLQALSAAHPDMAATLEAVPSINCHLDSPERVFAVLDTLERTRFQPPSRIVLDRSLNRDMNRLETTVSNVKHYYPDLHIHLMANEGCLMACPFKAAHDGHIAMVVEGMCGDRTFAMNRDLGCIHRFLHEPYALLTSPFIRPEDVIRYEGLADGIKLCGRNKGTAFLVRVLTAYVNEEHAGNLLDLLDAMGDISDRMSIPNNLFPDTFFDRVTACDKACSSCGWCAALAKKIITRMDPGLERL